MSEIKKGFVFQGSDIKKILNEATPWLKVVENQDSFVHGVEEDAFETGTRINSKVVGVQGDIDEEYVDLLIERITASGEAKLFSIPVAVRMTRDVVAERFDIPYIIAGTYATIEDGMIDILNAEERKFHDDVEAQLGDRTDKFAELFRKNNVKSLSDRELILLHKIKAEMKNSPILKNDIVTPGDLVAYFIEVTAEYIQVADELEHLLDGMAKQLEDRKDDLQDEADVRALEKDHKLLQNRVEEKQSRSDYFDSIIHQVILPVLM